MHRGFFSTWITTLAMQGQRRGGGGRHNSSGGRWKGRGNRGGGNRRPNNRHHFTSTDTGPDTTQIEEMGNKIPGETIAIAVEGCCHGKLDDIYARLSEQQEIELLICCGDFQSLRSTADFHSFAVPPKYHDLGSFHPYYTGAKVAPILTIFVGGNHEASQPLQELYYGGWVAPNIYYLGAAGVVQYRGIRIGGLSGIYKSYDYTQSRYEMPPFDRSTMRSVYHYRNVETYRLQCLSSSPLRRLEVMISHDWPQGIEQYGDTQGLLRRKPFFQQEVEQNALGSPPAMEVLKTIRPFYWFAAHLHVKFTAQINHENEERKTTNNDNDPTLLVPIQAMRHKTSLSGDQPTQFLAPESSSARCTTIPDLTDLMTQFLSLDKCLPRRHYLSIVHIPTKSSESTTLQYDPEWLAILKHTHELSRSNRKERVRVPNSLHRVTDVELAEIRELFENDFTIPTNWLEPTVPAETQARCPPLPRMGHPQTDAFLKRLGLDHIPNLTVPYVPLLETDGPKIPVDTTINDDNEIALESCSDDDAVMEKIMPEPKKPKMEESSLP